MSEFKRTAQAAAKVLSESAKKQVRTSNRLLNESAAEASFANPAPTMVKSMNMFRDLMANVKPTDRNLVLTMDGYSGVERPAFVNASLNFKRQVEKLAEEMGCPPFATMCLIEGAVFVEDNWNPKFSPHEIADFVMKLADILRCTPLQAHEVLCDILFANKKQGHDEHDIWNDPEYCHDFAHLHMPDEDEEELPLHRRYQPMAH